MYVVSYLVMFSYCLLFFKTTTLDIIYFQLLQSCVRLHTGWLITIYYFYSSIFLAWAILIIQQNLPCIAFYLQRAFQTIQIILGFKTYWCRVQKVYFIKHQNAYLTRKNYCGTYNSDKSLTLIQWSFKIAYISYMSKYLIYLLRNF